MYVPKIIVSLSVLGSTAVSKSHQKSLVISLLGTSSTPPQHLYSSLFCFVFAFGKQVCSLPGPLAAWGIVHLLLNHDANCEKSSVMQYVLGHMSSLECWLPKQDFAQGNLDNILAWLKGTTCSWWMNDEECLLQGDAHTDGWLSVTWHTSQLKHTIVHRELHCRAVSCQDICAASSEHVMP